MIAMLIDTNIYSLAMKGEPKVVSVLQRITEIAISAVSIGELLSGFKAGGREKQNRTGLEQFLDSPRVRVLCIDEGTAEFYAEILQNLRQAGTPIPTNDIWIAATAFQYGTKLFSWDQHFEKVPGLLLYR